MKPGGSETTFSAASVSVIECASVNAVDDSGHRPHGVAQALDRPPTLARAHHHRGQQQAEQEQHMVPAGDDVAHAFADKTRARRCRRIGARRRAGRGRRSSDVDDARHGNHWRCAGRARLGILRFSGGRCCGSLVACRSCCGRARRGGSAADCHFGQVPRRIEHAKNRCLTRQLNPQQAAMRRVDFAQNAVAHRRHARQLAVQGKRQRGVRAVGALLEAARLGCRGAAGHVDALQRVAFDRGQRRAHLGPGEFRVAVGVDVECGVEIAQRHVDAQRRCRRSGVERQVRVARLVRRDRQREGESQSDAAGAQQTRALRRSARH